MAGEILLNLKGGNKNMIKCFKKAISSVLAATMLATSFTAMPINTFAATSFSTAGGWFETLYAEWSGNKSDVTGVSYSGTASGSLTGDDLTYLVRQDGSNVQRVVISLRITLRYMNMIEVVMLTMMLIKRA